MAFTMLLVNDALNWS